MVHIPKAQGLKRCGRGLRPCNTEGVKGLWQRDRQTLEQTNKLSAHYSKISSYRPIQSSWSDSQTFGIRNQMKKKQLIFFSNILLVHQKRNSYLQSIQKYYAEWYSSLHRTVRGLNNIHRPFLSASCSGPSSDEQIGRDQARHHQTNAVLLTAQYTGPLYTAWHDNGTNAWQEKKQ